jgi:hypothetical protein
MTARIDREARFDAELRRVARAVVTEELPTGVLDPAVGASLGLGVADGAVRAHRGMPGVAAVAGAVAVLVLATAIAFAPRSPGSSAGVPTPSPVPTPTAAPVFRTTLAIRLDLQTLDYRCADGRPLASIGSGPGAIAREATVCTAPETIGPFMAAVIVGESAAGQVVDVHAKADFTNGDTPAARRAVASSLAKAAAISAVQGSGNVLGDWVNSNVGALEPNDRVSTVLEGLTLELLRNSDGGYSLRIALGGLG